MPSIADWHALAVRVGTVVRAEMNDGAHRPAYRMWIDFGDLGVLQSSAGLTERYATTELEGTQVVAVTGFDPIRVAGFRSDVLVLGVVTPEGVILIRPDSPVPPGSEIS